MVPLQVGIYPPLPTFFFPETENVDTATCVQHCLRMAQSGVAGVVLQGSTGEAVHLSHAERSQVTQAVVKALRTAGYLNMPVIVGAGAQSTRETIQLCNLAHADGGNYVLAG